MTPKLLFLISVPTKVFSFNKRYSTVRRPLYKREEAKKFRFYLANRYVEYLTKYETILEKRFPSAMKVYRVFMDGIKDFYKDTKEYLRLVKMLNIKGNTLRDLTRQEIELYHQMPKDMIKVAPVLLLSALPFANYVIFPLAYIFPCQLLCSHFWSIQQKSKFNILQLQQRLMHNRPVFRHLQSPLQTLEGHPLFDKWHGILASIGSGSHPDVDNIIACKQLFMEKPFHLFYLSRNHVSHLLLMHDMHRLWFRRSRLTEKATILQAMDRAIVREGGLEVMSTEALRKACIFRGVNSMNMTNQEMILWLNMWIEVSQEVDRESLSLLLHCPILLSYNHPSNWRLIYRKN